MDDAVVYTRVEVKAGALKRMLGTDAEEAVEEPASVEPEVSTPVSEVAEPNPCSRR